jgi:hypothetical protein
VIREIPREKPSVGRQLFLAPGYAFWVFETSLSCSPEEVWQDYNKRPMLKGIRELKYDLAGDDFCLHEFLAIEAALCSLLLLFEFLSEFQKVIGRTAYRQPATLRVQVLFVWRPVGPCWSQDSNAPLLHMERRSDASLGWTRQWLMFFQNRRRWNSKQKGDSCYVEVTPIFEAQLRNRVKLFQA